jgi:hypothetical protein
MCFISLPVICSWNKYQLKTLPIYAGMLDCPASGLSGTGMNKANDAGTVPVPE